MISIDDQFKILKDYKSGAELQYAKIVNDFSTWNDVIPKEPVCHVFNFEEYKYRFKPKPPKYLSILEEDYMEGTGTTWKASENDLIEGTIPAYLCSPRDGASASYVHQDVMKVKYLRVSKKSTLNGLTKCRMFDELEQAREGSALNNNSYVVKILLLEM